MSNPPLQSPPPGSAFFPAKGLFTQPRAVQTARSIEEVRPALEWARGEVHGGRVIAGLIAYEAAPAFDTALAAHAPGEFPLLWLASYDACVPIPNWRGGGSAPDLQWDPQISEVSYASAFAEIRERIAAGETYQVNYTFPMTTAAKSVDPWALFCALYAAQPVPHACYLNLGAYQVLSLSPELFFSLGNGLLRTRPMKGTRSRGRYLEDDAAIAMALRASTKDRAENVMITDMLRNDMARVSEAGSVSVENLFQVERYATVWQMTSSITSQTTMEVPEILAALFPSGSVTGAPKIQTSKIIRSLEPHPRGAYCGALGWWEPGGHAEFNVAIRTMTIEAQSGRATYHVGSGITWDATEQSEYVECLDKAAVLLRPPRPAFSLFETLRLERGAYWLIEAHLARMAASAAFFDRPFDEEHARESLVGFSIAHGGNARVRMTLGDDGSVSLEGFPLPDTGGARRVALASAPISRADLFLYHKTTHRAVYDFARASRPDVDDVLLYNENGELTESTLANLAVVLDGRCITPARECGLLAGTLRARLLADGNMEEGVVRIEDLRRAERVYLFNSVRGEMNVDIVA